MKPSNRKGVKPTDRPEPPPSHQESPEAAHDWAVDDFSKSIEVCYEAIRKRKAAGGPGWEPK